MFSFFLCRADLQLRVQAECEALRVRHFLDLIEWLPHKKLLFRAGKAKNPGPNLTFLYALSLWTCLCGKKADLGFCVREIFQIWSKGGRMGKFSFAWVKPRTQVPVSHSFVPTSPRCARGGLPFRTIGKLTYFYGKRLDLVSTVRTSCQLNFVKTVCTHSGQLRNPQYVRRQLLAAVALESHLGQSNKVERLVAARQEIPMYADNTRDVPRRELWETQRWAADGKQCLHVRSANAEAGASTDDSLLAHSEIFLQKIFAEATV